MADSMGIVHTADCIISIFQNEELEEQNAAIMKFLKNRYGPVGVACVVGLNKEYMKFYNIKSGYDISQSSKAVQHAASVVDETTKSPVEDAFMKQSKPLKTESFKFGDS
jgi:hypothetical protein